MLVCGKEDEARECACAEVYVVAGDDAFSAARGDASLRHAWHRTGAPPRDCPSPRCFTFCSPKGLAHSTLFHPGVCLLTPLEVPNSAVIQTCHLQFLFFSKNEGSICCGLCSGGGQDIGLLDARRCKLACLLACYSTTPSCSLLREARSRGRSVSKNIKYVVATPCACWAHHTAAVGRRLRCCGCRPTSATSNLDRATPGIKHHL